MNLITGILKDTELTIKTMNASMRGKNSDKRFEAIQTYSNKLQVLINMKYFDGIYDKIYIY
jgi:hypothetical protein